MFETILQMVNKFIPDSDQAKKISLQLEKEMTAQMELKSDIILAEQANGSGKWRVRLMYMCMTLVTLHFIMYEVIPYIRTAFDLNFYITDAPDNAELWSFLKIGVGGYIGSRGIEKSVSHFRRK